MGTMGVARIWPGDPPTPVWWEREPAERPMDNQKWGRGACKGGKEPVALKHGARAHRVPKDSVALRPTGTGDGGGV